jgi:ABC-type transporter Mla subunit MlaD
MTEVYVKMALEMLADISARLDTVDAKVDHLDEQLHEARRFIDEHRPALEAGLRRLAVLADPMAAIRKRR